MLIVCSSLEYIDLRVGTPYDGTLHVRICHKVIEIYYIQSNEIQENIDEI